MRLSATFGFAGMLLILVCVAPGCMTRSETKDPVRLSLMTYNIRIGKGGGEWNTDPTKVDLEPVSRIIAQHKPDITGVQELDRFRQRTSKMNQPEELATRLKMNVSFAPAYSVLVTDGKTEEYGIAALSRFPLSEGERFALYKPDYSRTHPQYPDYYSEQRALLHAETLVDGVKVHVFVTHLGLTVDQRGKQIAQIAEIARRYEGPRILLGDFNAQPDEPAILALEREFQNALKVSDIPPERRRSYPAGLASEEAIDYIFVSKEFRVVKAGVIRDATLASDHNPVVAEVELLRGK